MTLLGRFGMGAVVLATVAGIVAPLPRAAANAELHGPFGLLCGFTTATDPQVEGSQTGEIDGGPLVLTDLGTGLPDPTAAGMLGYTVQTGTNDTHAEADAASATGLVASALVLPPSVVTFEAGSNEIVHLCTSVTYAGGPTLYFDAANDTWTTSPWASCDLALSVEPSNQTANELDPVLCPVLASAFPPEGDVPGVWDCPPYRMRRGPDNDNGQGYAHRRRKDPDPDPDPDTTPPPPQPYYPKGTVTVSGLGNGQVSFSYSGFSPGHSSWTCTEGVVSVSCTPPPAPAGMANVCQRVTVSVVNQGSGTASGQSRCASGPNATASSMGPTTTPSTASATPGTTFPWTCQGTPPTSLFVQWSVTCTVDGP